MISANIGVMNQITPTEEVNAPLAELPSQLTLLTPDGPTGSVTPQDNSDAEGTKLSVSVMIAPPLDGIVSYSTIPLRRPLPLDMQELPLLRSKLISLRMHDECFGRVYNQSTARSLFITQARLP
jgi:hypothetical protein